MEKKKEVIIAADVVDANEEAYTNAVLDSNGKEIVVYGANNDVVLSTSFERIDFSDPQSFLRYGTDVAEEISQIVSDASELYEEGKVIKLDEAMLSKLGDFDKSLDESEKEAAKEAKKPGFLKALEGIVSRLKPGKEENTPDTSTYQGRLEEYLRNIDILKGAVESQKERQLSDIATRKETIAIAKPLVQQLEEMLKVARIDKKQFDSEIQALEGIVNPDYRTTNELSLKKQISGFTEERLNELNAIVVQLYQTVQTYETQQLSAMSLVVEQDKFLTHTSKILKAQGGIMIQNRILADDISAMAQLNIAANKAIASNADKMLENAEAVVELRLNGGVQLETLQHVNAVLAKGQDVYRKGDEALKQRFEKEKVEHNKLLESLKEYSKISAAYLSDNELTAEFIESSTKDSPRAGVKKLGSYPTRNGYKK